MKITNEYLNEIDACKTSKIKFRNSFPDGVEIKSLNVEVFDRLLFDDCVWISNYVKFKSLKFGMGVYEYKYDKNNNMIWKKYPSGDVYEYKYDENNNMIWKKYPSGNVYNYKYKYDKKYKNSKIIFH